MSIVMNEKEMRALRRWEQRWGTILVMPNAPD